jgi:putative transposase
MGLIRSMGGWSEVFASRRRGERQVADQRILGDGDFVKQVISGLDDLVKKNLRLSGRRIDIKALAEKVSERQCRGLVSENSVIPGLML